MPHCPCDPDRRYCSKACSKRNWAAHKQEHMERMRALAERKSAATTEAAEEVARQAALAEGDSGAKEGDTSVEAGMQKLSVGSATQGTPAMQNVCAHCFAPATLKCTACKAVFYCCKACQHSDWKKHKKQCA
jgi:hypothetical protein